MCIRDSPPPYHPLPPFRAHSVSCRSPLCSGPPSILGSLSTTRSSIPTCTNVARASVLGIVSTLTRWSILGSVSTLTWSTSTPPTPACSSSTRWRFLPARLKEGRGRGVGGACDMQ
eukprot:1800498-Rhodomonas_salina.1